MKDLVEYIVKQLVANPDAVSVDETVDGSQVSLLLKVAPEDMGIVIGKAGQTIKSIRKLLLVKAVSDGVRVNLQLFDENRPEGRNDSENSDSQSAGEPENPDESDKPEETETAETPSLSESSEETPQEETSKE